MFELDDHTSYSGLCVVPGKSDFLVAEIRPAGLGTYHLAMSLLRSRQSLTTREPVDEAGVITWLNLKIKREYSAAFTVADFDWKPTKAKELIFLSNDARTESG